MPTTALSTIILSTSYILKTSPFFHNTCFLCRLFRKKEVQFPLHANDTHMQSWRWLLETIKAEICLRKQTTLPTKGMKNTRIQNLSTYLSWRIKQIGLTWWIVVSSVLLFVNNFNCVRHSFPTNINHAQDSKQWKLFVDNKTFSINLLSSPDCQLIKTFISSEFNLEFHSTK